MSEEQRSSVQVNWQKFTLLAIALCGLLGLVILDRVAWSEVSPVFYLIVGYATANGIGAARNQPSTNLFTPSNPHRRADD